MASNLEKVEKLTAAESIAVDFQNLSPIEQKAFLNKLVDDGVITKLKVTELLKRIENNSRADTGQHHIFGPIATQGNLFKVIKEGNPGKAFGRDILNEDDEATGACVGG